MTIPRSRATPVAASPGLGPASLTQAGKADAGAVANGTASAAVTPPSAIRPSRSVAVLACVNGVSAADPTSRPPEAAWD